MRGVKRVEHLPAYGRQAQAPLEACIFGFRQGGGPASRMIVRMRAGPRMRVAIRVIVVN
ncbi:hypothetical protein GCM10007036_44250 [Alsobacter metallidurans]|uniref:Uncharacterized protein n=1 Tax=Alsobacter metallidurans TaxID=340221 RepID=A0A917IBT4_9HYPH|nr:hypothetical protein GCM10007036_44250 [Alsobacter metallidurans]